MQSGLGLASVQRAEHTRASSPQGAGDHAPCQVEAFQTLQQNTPETFEEDQESSE